MQNNQNQKPLTTYQNNPKEVFAEQAFIHFYKKVAAVSSPLQKSEGRKKEV